MAPIKVDPTAVTDATSSGSTKLTEDADATKKGDTTTADPRVKASLKALRERTGDKLADTSDKMDKANTGARNFEAADAKNSSKASSIPTPRYVPTASAAPAAPMPQSMPTPAAAAPATAAASMIPAALSTGANMASTGASMAAPAASQTMYALTPSQQAELASAMSAPAGGDAGSSAGSGPAASIKGSDGKLGSLVARVVEAHIPYAWGGGTLEGPSKGISDGGGYADANGDYNKTGFDCSGLTRYLYHENTGVEIPRTSQAQYAASTPVSDPQPGDLVFPKDCFNGGGPEHVQMYIGNGQVVEAPQSGEYVRVTGMSEGAIVRRPTGTAEAA